MGRFANCTASLLILGLQIGGLACDGDDCANDCERNDWPNVIVGVACDDGGSAVVVTGTFLPDGDSHAGDVRGCPVELDLQRYRCSVSYSTNPSVTSISLRAQRDGTEVSSVVSLREFNHCARDIAYVELSCDGEDMTFGPVQYISPCSEP